MGLVNKIKELPDKWQYALIGFSLAFLNISLFVYIFKPHYLSSTVTMAFGMYVAGICSALYWHRREMFYVVKTGEASHHDEGC